MGKVWSLGEIRGTHVCYETPDEKTFAVKPMNCPGCVQIFNQV